MEKLRKSWVAVIMVVLLLATLVGVVWARPQNRPQAQDITRKIVVLGNEFNPRYETTNYSNKGTYLSCDSASCYFSADVVFPCLPAVYVEQIKLHVYDKSSTGQAIVTLYRYTPSNKGNKALATAQTDVLGTSADPQVFTGNANNQLVWPSQKAYLWLMINNDVYVYAVTVEYHRNI